MTVLERSMTAPLWENDDAHALDPKSCAFEFNGYLEMGA